MIQRVKELEPSAGKEKSAAAEGSDSEKVMKIQVAPKEYDINNTWGDFDGSWLKWLGFRDRFKAAIHDNVDVSDSYKHSYLVRSLKGEAAKALGESHEAKGSYQEAWNRLSQLYNKPYQIALEYMRQFYRLPVLHTRATSTELQRMANATHETIRQLRALELPVDQYDFVLVHNLHERLDPETARDWEKYQKQRLQEMLTKITVGSEHRNKSKDRASAGSAKGNETGRETGAIPRKFPCEACPEGSGETHPLFHCPSFAALNITGRKDFLRRRRICPNCFKKGHNINSCESQKKCGLPQCQGNPWHNSLICPFKQNTQQGLTATNATKRGTSA
ncbi:uncharacterized protein LOC129579530 [Sitodiplosis mosellana]|uniref:uncharacterized protein LOC129579530 n=1 Tax=Sitodiplosis mosellana TaxID=263140 RepID=UPI002443F93F|nr:uncharacterized protein LOC129579530 [Sitodiplosis mosellana]